MQPVSKGTSDPSAVVVERIRTNLINFLLEVCPPLIGCSRNQLRTTLTKRPDDEPLKKFVSDSHSRVLIASCGFHWYCSLVGKEVDPTARAGKDDLKDEEEGPTYRTFIALEVDKRALTSTSLAFIKRTATNLVEDVEEDADAQTNFRFTSVEAIGSKLQILNLSSISDLEERGPSAQPSTTPTTPFEILTNYLQLVADPLFAAQAVTTIEASAGEEEAITSNRNITAARKKLAELLISVQQVQHNVEVPLVQLLVDPIVKDYVAKCKMEGRRFSPEEFVQEIANPSLLNQLQAGVNKWIKETQKVCKIDRDPSSGTTAEEVSFWTGFERALVHIEQQLQSPDVEATLAVLKLAKRFLAAVSFEIDTGLKAKLESVTNINLLLRDFPLNDLLSSNSIEQLIFSIRTIFSHMKKLKNVSHYPFPRAYKLVEAISRDLNIQLNKILASYNLLGISFEEFDHLFNNCRELSRVWEEEVRRFKELVRDQNKKKRMIHPLPTKLNCEHIILLDRVEDIRKVRRQHQKLQDVVRKVLVSASESAALREITVAYTSFNNIDALDVTINGQNSWDTAKKNYADKIDRVESQITNRLRDRLGAAKTGREMFRVFSQFNPLFFRPRIRGAIQEYQASLIQQVKDDMKALQLKFNERYERSQSYIVSEALDVPSTCGEMLWAKQLERKLEASLRHVEDVLGKGWEQHTEGQNLKQAGEEFEKKLNPQSIFDAWIKEIKDARTLDVGSRIFGIKQHGVKGFELIVNYDPKVMFLFKEVRYLTAMGIRVPYSVKATADDGKWIYPYLMTLQEAIRTFTHTCMRLEDPKFSTIAPLVASYKSEVQRVLQEGFKLRWDYEKLNAYTTRLCTKVYIFEAKVEDAEAQISAIDQFVEKLQTIEFDSTGLNFKEAIDSIQKVVSELVLSNYSNLGVYVKEIDARLESILIVRLEVLILTWVTEFENWPESGTSLIAHGSLHEFRVQNRQLYLFPPIEAARQQWMNQFHASLGTICQLSRLSIFETISSPAAKGADSLALKTDFTFRHLMEKISKKSLAKAYSSIDQTVNELNDYIQDWLKYQYLWDVEVSSVLSKVGEDLEAWQHLLTEIRGSRSTFDTSEERKAFGPIVIDYATAQNKVMIRFEAWHREIINIFGTTIKDQISQFSGCLHQAKEELESQIDSSKFTFVSTIVGDAQRAEQTNKVTQFVLKLQTAKSQEKEWSSKVENLNASEKLLERQRYAFPATWVWMDGVVGEWEAFQQLLRHQSSLLERHKTQLQSLVMDYDKWMQDSLSNAYADWAKMRPVQGDTQPQFALQAIARMEGKLAQLKAEYEKVSNAKAALQMDVDEGIGATIDATSGLTPALLDEELASLKGVWTELKGLFIAVDSLKETPWTAVVPKKVRQGLTDLLTSIKKIPAKFRQYETFEHLQMNLNNYLNSNILLIEMRSDALKERHWKRLLEILQLRSNIGLNDLTLGHLWDSNLSRYENQIRDVLSQAQGELALEEFLRMLRDTWTDYELDLVIYKNRCKLIRHWDDLFSLMDEHLNSLQSMKMSPYYKIFEEEANGWDDKLNRLRGLFDSWMEVQRRWVYLEGVFTGSADIQALLPNEFARFRSIDNDFLAIMKRTAARPKLLDVASTEGLQRSLDRLSELLSKIQKALGEYLERQRFEFPRFYFVGDEDLLEMIGNSKDVKIVQRHLNKMFSGISHFVTSSNTSEEIIAMGSKEGELVSFSQSICIPNYTSLNGWLRACEGMMFRTIADLLAKSVNQLSNISGNDELPRSPFFEWMESYPTQIVMLTIQIDWTGRCELCLKEGGTAMSLVTGRCMRILGVLADQVLHETDKLQRIKVVQLITEMVHQRDVCRLLDSQKVNSEKHFTWLQFMRFYWDGEHTDPLQKLTIKMANASFRYGFEYLGIPEKLVQTPLTDKCYLTLTQALFLKLGGNPFGPAGTGKTETVKALGAQLGRFVLVFCCDEAFDFQAMGRIFVGLCQVGAWGCFDEFNRLEERILSACSEQILTIQTGLKTSRGEIELLNKNVKLSPDMGIFVTMNPGYAGRSNLPDNLKQLFREIAMINPDKVQITQVLLYSQGFSTAERLSSKVVALFDLCLQQLSHQSHYDFGLRSLKSVLSSAGNLKRQSLQQTEKKLQEDQEAIELLEKDILLRSICDTLVPKLVAQDVPLLRSLLQGVFPGADILPVEEALLEDEVRFLCQARHFEPRPAWLSKVLQLYQIQRLNHGVMLVGPVGTGKSAAWKILLDSMERLDGIKGYSYILNAKSVPKEQLYGRLDPTTLEWTDGMFTCLLRKILNNVHGASQRRHWIVFDGDVDPEWAENLNSVLDDNKLLTLPNGERLQIPSNVRIMFEVADLRSATLATVSRCGMVWFSEEVLTEDTIAMHLLNSIRYGDIEEAYSQMQGGGGNPVSVLGAPSRMSSRHRISFDATQQLGAFPQYEILGGIPEGALPIADDFANIAMGPPPLIGSPVAAHKSEVEKRISAAAVQLLIPYFEVNGFVSKCLQKASEIPHVMDFTKIRVLESMFSLLRKFISQCIEYEELQSGTTRHMTSMHLEKVILKGLLFSVCWGCGGSMTLIDRQHFCQEVALLAVFTKFLPPGLDSETTLLDFELRVESGEWHHWRERVASVEIEAHQVPDANVIIETIDTMRHRAVLAAWLEEKKPFILCGPPGSGKTMTLSSTLKGLADFDIASLNFSSSTTPELLLKTFDHYCEYVKTTNGVVLRPSQPGKWLIVFADEINLPQPDHYGTQRVIMFMRQMQEYSGFWKVIDQTAGQWSWVKMERIQFAGACNPPTDAGRHPMSNRFLRHAPLMFVDFPGAESLKQIYGTFNRGMLRRFPTLRSYGDALTQAMVEFYTASQKQFTVDQQPHYIYSPRELTRWKVAMYEALHERESVDLSELVRLYIHEGLRIFQDRLVDQHEKDWTDDTLNRVAMSAFPDISYKTLERPILYCCYMTRSYEEVRREELREMIKEKLRVFNEEELNVQLVFFDQVLDHITRIDRVLRQPLGHLLLVGASGAGKTVLSKFVSWLNGLSVFQIKAGRNYDTLAFEADLRVVMKRAGLKDEKITFIFDESNALGPAFLERMNALLASGEVPGLFEGDEYIALMSEAKQCYGSDTGMDEADLFVRFTKQVQRNLHIVFTMNPANPDFSNRQATSPALFNRCVIDWFGDWPHDALIQVAKEFTQALELAPEGFGTVDEAESRHTVLANTIVSIHEAVTEHNEQLLRSGKRYGYLTPRDFLDFIRHFIRLVEEKKAESVENTLHLNVGLTKLKETETQVAELQASLAVKEVELQEKNSQAEEKMQLMVGQQAVAEERKKDAEALAVDLDKKSILVANRKAEVEVELKEVEPLLREAEAAVSNIPKKYLDELRALANPPQAVKLTVEAIVVMLNNMGTNPVSWDECRKILKGGDFINRVLSFDSNSTSPTTVSRINTKYLTTDNWDVEKIMRASTAAGPLAKWVESSLNFQIIVQKVGPLRAEILKLQEELSVNQQNLEKTKQQVLSLESKLQGYKLEYAQLISDVQMIKKEMEVVKSKVHRSSQLLKNLTSEKERWSTARTSSKRQLITAIGDCLLAGAFCTYLGFFEHADRRKLVMEWRELLEASRIRTLPDLSLVEYLSKPSDRFQWTANSLPSDELSIENAIILQRYIRYPLLIDPSGQASTYLSNQFGKRKMIKTSFMEPTFFKNLESALRFGTPLLVQDVEKIDPILNSVLNQETHKAGGRVLITVGDSDIDFSPMFTMFLTTRDPTAQFSPDLCSRVTFVNFTLTPSSLQNQCLNLALKSERPDVDQKRSDVLRLQGEFRIRIRELEDCLLLALSNVKGNILDEDSVISTLESLKSQAAEVAEEAARVDEVMAEVEKASAVYLPLAQAAARLYFTLQSMQNLHYLYHYDLHFFESVFHATLNDKKKLDGLKRGDYAGRLKCLFELLFQNLYIKCAMGLLHEDRLVLALQLTRIRFESEFDVQLGSRDLDLLLRGDLATVWDETNNQTSIPKSGAMKEFSKLLHGSLTSEQIKGVLSLQSLATFKHIGACMEKNAQSWRAFLDSTTPEEHVPPGSFEVTPSDSAEETALESLNDAQLQVFRNAKTAIREALLIKALRPDRLLSALTKLVELICGKELTFVPEVSQDDLHLIVTKQLKSSVPIMLVNAPGFDSSSKVLYAAQRQNQHVTSIAMGSEEGYAVADKAIVTAARNGTWVLLKNVHLASGWLQELEKKLFRMHLHESFRIFLTIEFSPKVPANLFRVSFVFVFEPPAGLKASMQRTYTQMISVKRAERQPIAVRSRLHFLLAFLHAVILERKRYIPFGWSKHYEFSDADQQCGFEIIDHWVDLAATGQWTSKIDQQLPEMLDPKKIPFDAIRTLLIDAVYGGRLDNEVDIRALTSFVDHIFRPEAFEGDFLLARGYNEGPSKNEEIPPLIAPDLGRSKEHYVEFIETMKNEDEPLWLGLAPRADRLISARQGVKVLSKWLTLHSKSAEDLHDLLPGSAAMSLAISKSFSKTKMFTKKPVRKGSGPVGWIAELLPRVTSMMQMLPEGLKQLERSEKAIEDPMFRYFDREVATASQLLTHIQTHLAQLKDVCEGTSKFTNALRGLAMDIIGDIPPKAWASAYKTSATISLGEWLADFCRRVAQLAAIGFEFGGGSVNLNDLQVDKYIVSVQNILGKNCLLSQNVVWFGGLQFPNAFLTATRQAVAQKLKSSLDDLVLVIDIGETPTSPTTFGIGGVVLENASWDSKAKTLVLTDTLTESLPCMCLKWLPSNSVTDDMSSKRVPIPLFLSSDRTVLVTMANLPVPKDEASNVWHQRGVALVLWSPM